MQKECVELTVFSYRVVIVKAVLGVEKVQKNPLKSNLAIYQNHRLENCLSGKRPGL